MVVITAIDRKRGGRHRQKINNTYGTSYPLRRTSKGVPRNSQNNLMRFAVASFSSHELSPSWLDSPLPTPLHNAESLNLQMHALCIASCLYDLLPTRLEVSYLEFLSFMSSMGKSAPMVCSGSTRHNLRKSLSRHFEQQYCRS